MSNFNTVAITALDAALTFARVGAEHPTVLAVRSWQDGRIEAVDLGAGDPISLYKKHGYDGLLTMIAAAPVVAVSPADLVQPVDLGAHHVAVGTNYPAHAGEADVEGGPFLFPKLVEPTGPYSPVPAGNGLLDYEVELAFVLLEDVEPGKEPAAVGLVLANEMTDRETLLRHVDPWNPTSGAGFTTGKSFPGFLPIGALFVIPRDVRAFVRNLELGLRVNGELRQSARVAEALWDFDRILGETAARRDVTWKHRGADVSLYPKSPKSAESKRLPARSLVLSGTPSGTVFQGISLATKLAGALRWVGSGFARSLPSFVVDAYLEDAQRTGIYLKPGDRVTIHADRLGTLENQIVEGNRS